MRCPYCFREITMEQLMRQGGEFIRYRAYDFGEGSPLPAGVEWERVEPARAPEVSGDVVVPLLQALITGVVAFLVGIGLCLALGWAIRIALGAGVAITALAWMWLLMDHRRLLRRIKRIVNVDLDRNGYVGEPGERIRLEVSDPEERSISFLDLPLGEERLRSMARLALAGRLGVRDMRSVMTDTEWARARDELLRAGLVRWRNPREPKLGLELTGAGRAVMKRILEGNYD